MTFCSAPLGWRAYSEYTALLTTVSSEAVSAHCLCYICLSSIQSISMSWWAPSWLSLPSVDFSLPSGIQGRFISFILKRTLGHFLKPGQLDIQQIDSQIGSGYVQVRDLELNYDVCRHSSFYNSLSNVWRRLLTPCLQGSPFSYMMDLSPQSQPVYRGLIPSPRA